MKFPDKFRVIWWIIVSSSVFILLVIRRDNVFSSQPTYLDIGLITIFLALLLLPLYSEISLFGMSIKQKIEKSNEEVIKHISNQIMLFRSEIQSTISNINHITQNVFPSQPSSDQILNEEIENIKSRQKAWLSGKEKYNNKEDQILKFDIKDEVLLAFKIRYLIEQELNRIWFYFFPNPPRPGLSLISKLGNLHRFGPISEDEALQIKEIISITNKAIHGDSISEVQYNYLREVAPIILDYLKNANLDQVLP